MDRTGILEELEQARADFHRLVEQASAADLRRRSDGTRWTNKQLLFHMVFGYLIVRTLLPLVHLLGRLGWSRRFAATLDAAHGPFHLVNYLGSVGGGTLLTTSAMRKLLDRTCQVLIRRLDHETEQTLTLAMHFPVRWDPYFRDTMSVLALFHYGTEHYRHHRWQLTLPTGTDPS